MEKTYVGTDQVWKLGLLNLIKYMIISLITKLKLL